jgi:hypothetical protein
VAGQFVSRVFVVLLRKRFPQKPNLQTAAVLSVTVLGSINSHMCKFITFLALFLFSEVALADSKWVFYCPPLKVFCSEIEHELEIKNPEPSVKYIGIASIENHSWSSEFILESNSTAKLEAEEGFCKNTYIYISFHESTKTECKYLIDEL